jgi:hypothetical protein
MREWALLSVHAFVLSAKSKRAVKAFVKRTLHYFRTSFPWLKPGVNENGLIFVVNPYPTANPRLQTFKQHACILRPPAFDSTDVEQPACRRDADACYGTERR